MEVWFGGDRSLFGNEGVGGRRRRRGETRRRRHRTIARALLEAQHQEDAEDTGKDTGKDELRVKSGPALCRRATMDHPPEHAVPDGAAAGGSGHGLRLVSTPRSTSSSDSGPLRGVNGSNAPPSAGNTPDLAKTAAADGKRSDDEEDEDVLIVTDNRTGHRIRVPVTSDSVIAGSLFKQLRLNEDDHGSSEPFLLDPWKRGSVLTSLLELSIRANRQSASCCTTPRAAGRLWDGRGSAPQTARPAH